MTDMNAKEEQDYDKVEDAANHSTVATEPGSESTDTSTPGYDAAPDDRTTTLKPVVAASDTVSPPLDSSSTDPFANPIDNASNATTNQEHDTPSLPSRPQATEQQEPVPPEVEGLKAMFPDFDVIILQSVLASVNGNQEQAADALLGMSDPSYVPQQQAAPTQTDLDEQLARRLMLEDQQRIDQSRWRAQQQNPQHQYYQPGPGQYDYNQQRQWNANQPEERDTMTEVQEQLSKFAETGKKTFASLYGKVRAKMQEFDQNRNASTSSPPQTNWGSGTVGGSSNTTPSQNNQGQYNAPNWVGGSGRTGLGDSREGTGYDAAQTQTQPESNRPISISSPFSAPVAPAERIPPRPSSTGPPPAGNVDPIKIGMLPKRVSTLDASPTRPQANVTNHQNDDDDELDYVENPFAEGQTHK